MASQNAIDNMCTCSKSWPSDLQLFQKAVSTAPNYAALMDLVNRVREAMREKDLLDQCIGEVLGYKVDAAGEWPTKNVLFLTAIAKLNSRQDYMGINYLQDLRSAANKGIAEKRNLDASIVQILEGTFAGDFNKAYELWIAENPEGCSTPPCPPIAGTAEVAIAPKIYALDSCGQEETNGYCLPGCCCSDTLLPSDDATPESWVFFPPPPLNIRPRPELVVREDEVSSLSPSMIKNENMEALD